MRDWKLGTGDPLSLTLTSDVRLGQTNYLNDHIWDLSIGNGEPKALMLETTFGLRAKSLRVYPRFRVNEFDRSNPQDFAQPVIIKRIYPNYIALHFTPVVDIEIQAEYFIPEPYAVAIRLTVENQGKVNRKIYVDWIAQLAPKDGQRMSAVEIEAATVLCGETERLFPVLFNTGAPKEGSGSYPSLMSSMELAPDAVRQFTCVIATKDNRESSFSLARQIAAMNWEAEIARLEMMNAGQLEIYTGQAKWDAALMLSQKHAISLLHSPTQLLSRASFVYTRRPDQGFSLTGDGFDYNHYWNGQSPLEAYYLCDVLLPIAPEICVGILQNFLSVQEEDGTIDWKPGFAGQRSHCIATPVLCSLTWNIYQQTEDLDFLREVYPGLKRFVQAWFSEKHDRDGDGIPEWDNPLQFGADDHPLYAEMEEWSHGIQIQTSEGPALCSFLYRECQILIQMAALIGEQSDIETLEELALNLKNAVEASWDDETNCYYDWDRDTHQSTQTEWLGGLVGPGGITIQQEFEHPVRLSIHLHLNHANNRKPLIFVHGKSASGERRVERIRYDDFRWRAAQGKYTGKLVYSALERFEIQGLAEDEEILIFRIGYRYPNVTLLAPLWAGIPGEERSKQLIQATITNEQVFWHPYGLPFCPDPPDHPEARQCRSIDMIWNTLVTEGLVKYKYRDQAAELFARHLNAIVENLQREGAFHKYYDADHGKGVGVHGILNGIAPVGLFLKILGVRLLSSNKVIVEGQHPFKNSVSIKYRGLTILRKKDHTTIIFSDGQTSEITDTERHTITLE